MLVEEVGVLEAVAVVVIAVEDLIMVLVVGEVTVVV
jgi:hypothetical protein